MKPDQQAQIEAIAAQGKSLRTVIPADLAPVPATPKARPRGNKYGAKPKEYGGLRYDSTAEADYAKHLDDLLAAGAINGWSRQVTFLLGVPENRYRCDFLVFYRDGKASAVDVKGHRTAKFLRDVKLWRAYGPCPLVIVTRKGTRGWAEEIIQPGSKP